MLISTHSQNPTPLRSVRATVDFEGVSDELLTIHVNGVDTGVRVRLDGTGDGVLLVAGDKMFRHPVGDSDD
jgi:hypothetical protein